MVGSLNTINPYYTGINSNQLPGITELWLEEEKFNRSVPSSHISDGTLKFLCLMSILYNPNRGFIVCIDEPELGLHPDMINTLHEAIEFASETSQIIISTHSAHLLNYFDIEQVRVFEKDENNATIVEQYSKADFAGWHQKFQTGKAWREGDIGGKRW
jgi:predicted ATPase